ncbi:hypothetical protein [Catellatospora paridis]|nr:hypothetical protein [Catellatospora paridis]
MRLAEWRQPAAEQPRREHRVLRLCDATACYVAWRAYDEPAAGWR